MHGLLFLCFIFIRSSPNDHRSQVRKVEKEGVMNNLRKIRSVLFYKTIK